MIIDTHTHFYDPFRPQGVPWPTRDDRVLYRRVMPENFRTAAAPSGIGATIVIEASPWAEDNHWLLELARTEPLILGVVGSVNPDNPASASQLSRLADDRRFRGVRLSLPKADPVAALATPSYQRVLKQLADARLTLDLLVKQPAAGLFDELRKHPDLRIVLDHVAVAPDADGRPAPAWARWLGEVGQLPNVYCKLSGFLESASQRYASVPTDADFYREVFDTMLGRLGPARLLYASNWPVIDRVSSYDVHARILLAWADGLGEDTRERVLCRNAVDAYGPLPGLADEEPGGLMSSA
ncbi:amidohydrolase [Phycisphaerales bacterium AB-hyl4]|uniref:Amidohydrolase n=1 Tax=Natronomicrosphaera hydrolytica TaxID=3242702 RepID=A0ABV4U752_9BACT